jgi:hypothetical protein
VAVHDEVGTRVALGDLLRRRRAQSIAVHDEDAHTGELAARDLGQPEPRVDVPTHRSHRCDSPESVEHVERPDIAGVEDVLHARERLQHLRAEETVRVGDQPDQHRRWVRSS